MSFRISSSRYPTASLAAILAMGKPVALEASADERDTRGFISITATRPWRGSTANWMYDPPGEVAQHLVLLVGERLGRGHGDRVAGVDAHRVEVLDRADDDEVVLRV